MPKPLLEANAVREYFGYTNKSAAAWWQFVRQKGVPHIVLGPRNIMFDPEQLNRWIAKRSSNGEPGSF